MYTPPVTPERRSAYKKAAKAIRDLDTFLIGTHIGPEGDAVGSSLATAGALRGMGKKVEVLLESGVPEALAFLPGADSVHNKAEGLGPFDATIAVDCTDPGRLGKQFGKIKDRGLLINIDHHKTNNLFGAINIVDAAASASAVLIYSLLQKIPVEITPDIAVNLYTAILTDTGSFHYSNTNPEALNIAAELIRAGADPSSVAEKIYETYSEGTLRLLAMALDTLELSEEGRLATIVIRREMVRKSNAPADVTDEFINYPRSISGVDVAILFREVSKRIYKASFRSRGRIDVSAVASSFGGGGHPNAAGCLVRGTLEEIKEKVCQATRGALAKTPVADREG